MGSDFSKRLFDKTKNYSGALLQQGRVILDSDWNEQWDLYQHRLKTETVDVIGPAGVPLQGDSFLISHDSGNLTIAPGRIYIDGLLCENHASSPINYQNQDDYPSPEFVDKNGVFSLEDGKHIVYLKAWQREINHLDDPDIKEVALGEADTTVRIKTTCQVRIIKVEDNIGCSDESDIFKNLLKESDGKLEVRTHSSAAADLKCKFQDSDGYRRLENQLYRIEVHETGDLNTAKFKWSRDNATVETKANINASTVLNVDSLGKDDYLNFKVNQWVELLDENLILNNQPGKLYKIKSTNSGLNQIELFSPIIVGNLDPNKLRLRRWDVVSGAIATKATLPTGWIDIEGGIQLKFSPGKYKSGDYWQFAARTASENIEWPHTSPALPHGIDYAYAKLAVITVIPSINGTTQISHVEDCRNKFPTLSDLYEAYLNKDGCCTIHVFPEPNWADKLQNKLSKFRNAKICFAEGNYELEKPLEISNKGHLVISGCGSGTIISSIKNEVAFFFNKCDSVTIRDIYGEGIIVSTESYINDLNGVFTFIDCIQVDIFDSTFKTGAGSDRGSTCITCRNENPSKPVRVRIQNCEMFVGHLQQGILLVNAIKVLIEGNNITNYDRAAVIPIQAEILTNSRLKKDIGAWLFGDYASSHIPAKQPNKGEAHTNAGKESAAGLSPDEAANILGKEEIVKSDKTKKVQAEAPSKSSSKFNVKFLGDKEKVFSKVTSGKEITTKKEYEKVSSQALSFLLDPKNIKEYGTYSSAFTFLNSLKKDAGAVGITIGGKRAEDVRIINNNISNFLQGVHVGLSHENEAKEPYMVDKLDVSNNSIINLIPPYITSFERYGIYVGNCNILNIDNNNLALHRLVDFAKDSAKSNKILIEGIRVNGFLGLKMRIANNTISGIPNKEKNPWNTDIYSSYDNAIKVYTKTKKLQSSLWRVHDNVAIARNNPSIVVEPDSIRLNDDGQATFDVGGKPIVDSNGDIFIDDNVY